MFEKIFVCFYGLIPLFFLLRSYKGVAYLLNKVSIDMTVDIVPDLDEYEPVPHAHVVAAHGHLVRLAIKAKGQWFYMALSYPSQEPGLASQDELSHPPRGYGEDSPDQLDSRDCGEEDKPKPEHDVDLDKIENYNHENKI